MYKEPHPFWVVKVEKHDSWIFRGKVSVSSLFEMLRLQVSAFKFENRGPISADFINANLDNFDGFLELADRIGLDWLATVAPDMPKGTDSLALYLERNFSIGAGSRNPIVKDTKPIPSHHVKRFYDDIKNTLIFHQQVLSDIYDALLSGDRGLKFATFGKHQETINEAFTGISTGIGVHSEAKGACFTKWTPKTLLARFYAEVVSIELDGAPLKRCKHCNCLFIPDRPNEDYCGRYIGGSIDRTCKDVGAMTVYNETLRKNPDSEKAKYRNEDQRRLQALRRLKIKHGEDSDIYKTQLREHQQWRENRRDKSR